MVKWNRIRYISKWCLDDESGITLFNVYPLARTFVRWFVRHHNAPVAAGALR